MLNFHFKQKCDFCVNLSKNQIQQSQNLDFIYFSLDVIFSIYSIYKTICNIDGF